MFKDAGLFHLEVHFLVLVVSPGIIKITLFEVGI